MPMRRFGRAPDDPDGLPREPHLGDAAMPSETPPTRISWRMGSGGVTTALRLLSSTIVAQIAVLAATVVSAAWLLPRDFAYYGAAFGIAGIVSSFNTLGIETRLAVVEAATMARLLRTGLAACLGIAALGTVVALFVAGSDQWDWGVVIALAMAASMLSASQTVVTTLALRVSQYGVLARSRVAQGIVNAALIVTFSALPMPGYVALTGAWILSMVVGLIVSLRGWVPPFPASWRLTTPDVSATRAEVGLQPVTSLLAAATVLIPLVVLPLVASASLAGSWALSTRVLGAAVMSTYASLQPVYYATAAEFVRGRAFPRLAGWHRRWAVWLTAATIPGFTVAGLVIAYGLPLLGDQWMEARALVIPACLYWGSQFFGLPLSQTLLLVGRIRLQLIWTVARFVAATAAFALWPLWGALASIWAWSIVCVVTFFILTVIQARVLRHMASQATTAPNSARTSANDEHTIG